MTLASTLMLMMTNTLGLARALQVTIVKLYRDQLEVNALLAECAHLTTYQSNFLHYGPQRSWGKVMFLHVCVIVFTRGGLSASVHAGIPPSPSKETPTPPARQTPPWQGDPPTGKETPRQGDPPGKDTPHWQGDPYPTGKETTPGKETPRRNACWEIRSTSGRYASYWNVILVFICFSGKLG